MIYEYGYILTVGGETKTEILGTVDESELAQKQKDMDRANRAESAPGIRGKMLANPAHYFVRPVEQKANAE